MCDHWGIGWAPSTSHALCDHLADTDLAYDVGVAGRDDATGRTWDFMRGRITFELKNPAGQVTGFAGRTLKPETSTNPKYVNTRNNAYHQKAETLFAADRAAPTIAATRTAVIVEGYTDVIAAHKAGITNTVAACGTAIGAAHLHTLRTLGTTHITALFDGDTPGRDATDRLAQNATQHHLPVAAARLPNGKDPADLTPEQLAQVLARTEPALLTGLHAALAGHQPADARRTAQQLAEILSDIDLTDPATAAIVRTQLIDALGTNWHRAAPQPNTDHPRETAPPDRHPISID